jgi:uncharacterized RDD family membrane protein YckC
MKAPAGKEAMATRVIDGEIITSRLDDIHAYDGVRTRRVMACIMDYVIVGLLLIPFGILVFFLGLLTLGLGWSLFGVLAPLVAALYVWNTLGGPDQATVGMRMMGIRLDRLDGGRIDGLTAVVHTVLFWAGNVVLTPLVLLITLFSERKRTLHDLLLGTVVTRADRY